MSRLADRFDKTLERVIPLVRRVTRLLGPEDDWVERDRKIFWQAAERLLGQWHTFVTERNGDEHLTTVAADSDAVERALMEGPYQRNLLSNRKYRVVDVRGEATSDSTDKSVEKKRDWAVGSFAYQYEPEQEGDLLQQHHVFLFDNADGTTDVYSHSEPAPSEGAEHFNWQKVATSGKVFDCLDRAELSYQ